MERINRRFILFQGIAVGTLTIAHAMDDIHGFIIYPLTEEWDYHNDIHGLHEVIIPRELCWILAAGVFLHGIYRHSFHFFYPIIFVAIGEMIVLLGREIVLVWFNIHSDFWHLTLFCDPVVMVPYSCKRIYGMMTLMALKRLYESEQTTDNNFVRFNAESDECEVDERSRNRL